MKEIQRTVVIKQDIHQNSRFVKVHKTSLFEFNPSYVMVKHLFSSFIKICHSIKVLLKKGSSFTYLN